MARNGIEEDELMDWHKKGTEKLSISNKLSKDCLNFKIKGEEELLQQYYVPYS